MDIIGIYGEIREFLTTAWDIYGENSYKYRDFIRYDKNLFLKINPMEEVIITISEGYVDFIFESTLRYGSFLRGRWLPERITEHGRDSLQSRILRVCHLIPSPAGDGEFICTQILPRHVLPIYDSWREGGWYIEPVPAGCELIDCTGGQLDAVRVVAAANGMLAALDDQLFWLTRDSGHKTRVNLYNDFADFSFYFVKEIFVQPENAWKYNYNGGIIFHRNYAENGRFLNEFSMGSWSTHT